MRHTKFFLYTVSGLIALFAVVVCVLSFKSDLWEIDSPVEKCHKIDSGWHNVTEPSNIEEKCLTVERVFTPEDVKDLGGGPTLFFKTLNVRVRVYVNGYRVYSFGNHGKRIVGNESGPSLHFIRLSNEWKKPILVTLQIAESIHSPNRNLIMPEIYFGSKAACIEQYIYSCLSAGIMSLAIIIVGIVGLFLAVAFRISRKQFISEYFFWGLFSLVAGIGFMLESGAADIVAPNSFFIYFISTLVLAAEPAFFLVYVNQSKTLPYNKKVSKFFKIVSYLECIIVCIFAFIPSVPFHYVKTTAIIILIAFLFFIIAITINEAVAFIGRLSVTNALVILAAVSLVADFTLYLFPPYPVDPFLLARPCFLLFLIVRSVSVINDFYNVQILTARKDMYEDTVSRDNLTGTYTRPAFWRAQRELERRMIQEKINVTLVLCEIVNLKNINEHKSFEAGDDTLRLVANALQQLFQPEKIYRFDGSGFGILMVNYDDKITADKIQAVDTAIREFNKKGISEPIELCYGCRRFDKKIDEGFEQFITHTQDILRKNRISHENSTI